jgi:hypothetical protein
LSSVTFSPHGELDLMGTFDDSVAEGEKAMTSIGAVSSELDSAMNESMMKTSIRREHLYRRRPTLYGIEQMTLCIQNHLHIYIFDLQRTKFPYRRCFGTL